MKNTIACLAITITMTPHALGGGVAADFGAPNRSSADRGDYNVPVQFYIATNAATDRPAWATSSVQGLHNWSNVESKITDLAHSNNGCLDFDPTVSTIHTSESAAYRSDWPRYAAEDSLSFPYTNAGPSTGVFIDVLWPTQPYYNHPGFLNLISCPIGASGCATAAQVQSGSNPTYVGYEEVAYDVSTLFFDWALLDSVIAARPSSTPITAPAPTFENYTYEDLETISSFAATEACASKVYPTPAIDGNCTVAANAVLTTDFTLSTPSHLQRSRWTITDSSLPALGVTAVVRTGPANGMATKTGTSPEVGVGVPAAAHVIMIGSHGPYNDLLPSGLIEDVAVHEFFHAVIDPYLSMHDAFSMYPQHVLGAGGDVDQPTGGYVPDVLHAVMHHATVQSSGGPETLPSQCVVETRIPYSYAVGNNQCFQMRRHQTDFVPHYWMNGHLKYEVRKDYSDPAFTAEWRVQDVIEDSQQYMAVYIPEDEDGYLQSNSCITAGEVPNLLIDKPSTSTPSAPSPWRFRMGKYGGGEPSGTGDHHSFYWATCGEDTLKSVDRGTGWLPGKHFVAYHDGGNLDAVGPRYLNMFTDLREISSPELLLGSEETWVCDPVVSGILDPNDVPNSCEEQTFTWSPGTGLFRELLLPALPMPGSHDPDGDMMGHNSAGAQVVQPDGTIYRRIGPGEARLNEVPWVFGYTPVDVGGAPQPFGVAGPVGPFDVAGTTDGEWSSTLGTDAWSDNGWSTCLDYLAGDQTSASALQSGTPGPKWSKGTIAGTSNKVWSKNSEVQLPSIHSNSSSDPTKNRSKHDNIEPVASTWPTGTGHSGDKFPTDMLHWMQLVPASESDPDGPLDSTYACSAFSSSLPDTPDQVCLAGYEAKLQ